MTCGRALFGEVTRTISSRGGGSMCRIGEWAILGATLLGCTHGYAVKLNATHLDQVDPAVVAKLSDAAISRGLTAAMLAHRNIDAPSRNLTSAFSKEISTRPHDAIEMNIFYSDGKSSERGIFVFIEKIVTGMEAPVKQ